MMSRRTMVWRALWWTAVTHAEPRRAGALVILVAVTAARRARRPVLSRRCKVTKVPRTLSRRAGAFAVPFRRIGVGDGKGGQGNDGRHA